MAKAKTPEEKAELSAYKEVDKTLEALMQARQHIGEAEFYRPQFYGSGPMHHNLLIMWQNIEQHISALEGEVIAYRRIVQDISSEASKDKPA